MIEEGRLTLTSNTNTFDLSRYENEIEDITRVSQRFIHTNNGGYGYGICLCDKKVEFYFNKRDNHLTVSPTTFDASATFIIDFTPGKKFIRREKLNTLLNEG